MRVGFVSGEGLRSFSIKQKAENADLLLFGLGGLGEVDYERELKGESSDFEELARLSKQGGNVVVCGCVTNTHGHKRRSAIVAEAGKLLGVSDALYAVDGSYSAGAQLRVYSTEIGKMGTLVGEDLYFPEAVRALTLCGSDFIVCPYGKSVGELPSLLLRATAFWQGISILFCGKGYCAIATPEGELAFSSPVSPAYVDFTPKREYHLIERRRLGYFPPT